PVKARRAPKRGARYRFELSGSVQGFQADQTGSAVSLRNVERHSREGRRSLAISYDIHDGETAARVSTPTFIPPEAIAMPGYALYASPILHSGQTLNARLGADESNPMPVTVRPYVVTYGADDAPTTYPGPAISVGAIGEDLVWRVPDTAGAPIF